MNLCNQSDLSAIAQWVDKKLEAEKTGSRDFPYLRLLDVLLSDCTPYLGGHTRVEDALRQFRKEKKIRNPATKNSRCGA